MIKRIYFFSPIVPLRTGTADYFTEIVTHFTIEERLRSLIVVEDSRFPRGNIPAEFDGIDVVSHRAVPTVPAKDELFVLFVANNVFHAYIHRILAMIPPYARDRSSRWCTSRAAS